MYSPFSQLLHLLESSELSLTRVLVTLFTNPNLAGHPALHDVLQNCKAILQLFLQHTEVGGSVLDWAIGLATSTYCEEVYVLTQEKTGLHFHAKKATAKTLDNFSMQKQAAKMGACAPQLWKLLDSLLEADGVLKERRERYALKKTARVSGHYAARSAGAVDVDPVADEEEDRYWAELGVVEELEGVGGPLPLAATALEAKNVLRSKRESLRVIKKVVLISIMMKSTNQRCNALASVIGLFAHSSNTPERVIETLSHAGLSIGSNTINEAVDSLSKEAATKLKELGQTLTAAYAYDNFDVALNVATSTVESGGKMLAHLTSGTLIRLEHGVTAEDLKCSKEVWQRSLYNPKKTGREDFVELDATSLLELHPEPDMHDGPSESTRRSRYQAWQFRHDLITYGPSYFARFRKQLGVPEPVEPIPVVKTYQVPARAMDINESTVKGNADAIQCLLRQGGVGDPSITPGVVDVSEYVVIFHGDLGTLERVQSLQQSRGIEKSPWLQFRYIVFIPGFFHLKMACADAIWRAFVKPKKSRLDPTSTMEHAGIFRPQETGIIGSNPGFRRMHDLTQHDGIIRRLDCWRVEVQRRTSSAAMTLDDFAAMKPTWEDIEAMSYDLVTRYVASGDFSRAGSASERDQDFENSLLRNQCYLLYEEITYAMNAGDVGRLEIALATWILVFKGTGKNKYAAQMTKFLLEVNFLYPERLR
ncbi:hypothetical protein BV25DRAFT_1913685 [Artomyces pyxidatus]|uniref:Uncharacterized protein n=1 Tax=Artomyces pyxidatus TaxID=48021 RepID=A0ACB8TAL2_9AGAM|nr:hypothetical protein BV25DRAFT_1913685 [Artomyces pyxidatus]